MYTEEDEVDLATRDYYAASKINSEKLSESSLVIRTSFIGPELGTTRGLFEWFLHSDQRVNGYTEAYFSGMTTRSLSQIIAKEVILNTATLQGIYHIGGERISKYDLLVKLNAALNLNKTIVPDDQLRVDRSLSTEKFNHAITGYFPYDWDSMIADIKFEGR